MYYFKRCYILLQLKWGERVDLRAKIVVYYSV